MAVGNAQRPAPSRPAPESGGQAGRKTNPVAQSIRSSWMPRHLLPEEVPFSG